MVSKILLVLEQNHQKAAVLDGTTLGRQATEKAGHELIVPWGCPSCFVAMFTSDDQSGQDGG